MDKMVNEFDFTEENCVSNIDEIISKHRDIEYVIKHLLRMTVDNLNKGDSISIDAADLPIKSSSCNVCGAYELLDCVRNINFSVTLIDESSDPTTYISHESSVYTDIEFADGIMTLHVNKHMNWDKFKELPEVIKIVCG